MSERSDYEVRDDVSEGQVDEDKVRPDLRSHIDSSAPMSRADATELTEELDPGVETDAMEMDATTVQDLPQAAIDAGWQYAQRGGNADELSKHDTQVVSDIEVAYENVSDGVVIVGRGHSYTEAYRDALRQMNLYP